VSQNPVDAAFDDVRFGDDHAYARWVSMVEPSLLRSLRSFARQVDVEAVMQESLLRMWVLAPRLDLRGANASLRYVQTIARNLALRETERQGCIEPTDPEQLEEVPVEEAPTPDPALRRRIMECLAALSTRPRKSLLLRLEGRSGESDRELAASLGMRLNTFLQNVVRARKALKKCLESHGISLQKVLR
jgi:RNA polymerase sigma factor (sigma-70 family)